MLRVEIEHKEFVTAVECAEFCQLSIEEITESFKDTVHAVCDLVINVSGQLFSETIVKCSGYTKLFIWPFFPVHHIEKCEIAGQKVDPIIGSPMCFSVPTLINLEYKAINLKCPKPIKVVIFSLVYSIYIKKIPLTEWTKSIKEFIRNFQC